MTLVLRPLQRHAMRAWTWYSGALERRPFFTKGCTAFTIYSAADIVRQRYEFKQLEPAEQLDIQREGSWVDWARATRLSSWYAVVHAPWIHVWYGFLDKLYGVGPGFRLAFKKVVTDQTINMPIFLGVTLYVSARMAGLSHSDAWEKTKRDHLETIIGAALCWVPALSVNFMYVPPKYRLLFVNVVQVGFGVFLSKMANRSQQDAEAAAAIAFAPHPKNTHHDHHGQHDQHSHDCGEGCARLPLPVHAADGGGETSGRSAQLASGDVNAGSRR